MPALGRGQGPLWEGALLLQAPACTRAGGGVDETASSGPGWGRRRCGAGTRVARGDASGAKNLSNGPNSGPSTGLDVHRLLDDADTDLDGEHCPGMPPFAAMEEVPAIIREHFAAWRPRVLKGSCARRIVDPDPQGRLVAGSRFASIQAGAPGHANPTVIVEALCPRDECGTDGPDPSECLFGSERDTAADGFGRTGGGEGGCCSFHGSRLRDFEVARRRRISTSMEAVAQIQIRSQYVTGGTIRGGRRPGAGLVASGSQRLLRR